MFLNKARLPHVLPPELYSSQQQYVLELERIFRVGWHVIGTVADAPNDGDFFTLNRFGTPLLVRNYSGTWHTFLNVCPHRHSLLSRQPMGHSPVLKCQYHGWEFNQDGRTGKIPDAQCFRPLPGGPECLQKFHTEIRGPLIFAKIGRNQDELDSENLDAQLGPFADVIREFPASRWRQSQSWSYDFPANWKVVAENTVESYHVAEIHPKTLVFATPEADTQHEMHPQGSIMRSKIVAPKFYYRMADWMLPRLQPDCSHEYRLHHIFPGLFFIRIDAMLQVMLLVPTSPTTCHMKVSVFTLTAAKETLQTRWITWFWGRMKCSIIKKVLAEDAALYPDLQRGMAASPFNGTISTREELVYALQAYVARRCKLDLVIDPTADLTDSERQWVAAKASVDA